MNTPDTPDGLIDLVAAARLCPDKVSAHRLLAWHLYGVPRTRLKLECVRLGTQYLTTRDAVLEFLRRSGEAAGDPSSPRIHQE
jgi:hypothetical protein